MKKEVKLYSAFFPFYGILLANYKDVLWMTAANIAVLTLIAFLVLKTRKTPELKKTLPEMGMAPKIQILNDYIERVMPEIKSIAERVEDTSPDWVALNELFLRIV